MAAHFYCWNRPWTLTRTVRALGTAVSAFKTPKHNQHSGSSISYPPYRLGIRMIQTTIRSGQRDLCVMRYPEDT